MQAPTTLLRWARWFTLWTAAFLLAGCGTLIPQTVGLRTDWPAATIGTSMRASWSAKSGGAHTLTSAPCSRNCTASPAIGSTSPRDPHVDNNTRISRPPVPRVSGFGQRFCDTIGVLPQAPLCAIA